MGRDMGRDVTVPKPGSDQAHAEYVRSKLAQLRDAIEDARGAGLTVTVPELVHLYLDAETASGGPMEWKIYRNH